MALGFPLPSSLFHLDKSLYPDPVLFLSNSTPTSHNYLEKKRQYAGMGEKTLDSGVLLIAALRR